MILVFLLCLFERNFFGNFSLSVKKVSGCICFEWRGKEGVWGKLFSFGKVSI